MIDMERVKEIRNSPHLPKDKELRALCDLAETLHAKCAEQGKRIEELEAMVRRGEKRGGCERCGGFTASPLWQADHDVWEAAVGTKRFPSGEWAHGCYCLFCFCAMAEEKNIWVHVRVEPHPKEAPSSVSRREIEADRDRLKARIAALEAAARDWLDVYDNDRVYGVESAIERLRAVVAPLPAGPEREQEP